MSLSLFPRAVAPLRLAVRSVAPSAGVLPRWAASTPAASAAAGAGSAAPAATPLPTPAPAVVAESTTGAGYATTATSSARNAPVANLQGAQPIGNSEYVVRLGGRAAAAALNAMECAGWREGDGVGWGGSFFLAHRGVPWSVKRLSWCVGWSFLRLWAGRCERSGTRGGAYVPWWVRF